MRTIETGKIGEEEAVKFLKKNKYKIIERNFRTKFGEIDIIAKKGNKVVFIEVKTRKTISFGYPEEAVDERKLNKIKKVALYYIQKNKIKSPVKVEVLSILIKDDRKEFKIIPLE